MKCEARSFCSAESIIGRLVNSTSPNMHRVKTSKAAAPIQKWTEQLDLFDQEGFKIVLHVILFSIAELSNNCQLLFRASRPPHAPQCMNDLRFQRGSFKQKSWRQPKSQQLRGGRGWLSFSVCGAAWWDC